MAHSPHTDMMTCLVCKADIPFPPKGSDAVCPGCGSVYASSEDLGWFNYSAHIYRLVSTGSKESV